MSSLQRHITMAKSILLILFLSIGQQTRATGVFELELISLKQIESTRLNENKPNNHFNVTSDNHQQNSTTATGFISESANSANNFVRIFVCLKEAFTSKLDGPCTFGNASLTLNGDSIQTPSEYQVTTPATRLQTNNQDRKQTPNSNKQVASQQQQQQLTQGSLMTNIVRILFTFRWTKSFTIILTAEQIDIDNQETTTAERTTTNPNLRSAQVVKGAAANGTTNAAIDRSTTSGIGGSKFRFIDRHVLTENEVLPNLELNPNKPWANRFSRSLKSSLAYRFRIYCSLNYYGDGCTTFCRPRDDQFGHYNCSSTGQKVCLDGWTGPDCDKARCRSGCSQQHGYCEKPDTCQCRPGWTGLRCDECITYPGCQSGYCLSPWQCICQRNWGGVLCDQDLNYCGTHEPCKNNGTCQNIAPGKYKCSCPDGFTGVDCDINLELLQDAGKMTQLSAGCALNPCLNGGTCFGFNNSPPESSGRELRTAETIDAVISGNSNIEHSERIYRCQCPLGWTGDYCQWSDINNIMITSLILNTSEPDIRPDEQQANTTTESTVSISNEAVNEELQEDSNGKLLHPIPTTTTTTNYVESTQASLTPSPSHHLDMKHLISGVVIASVFGVFLAALLLAWCCLVAIERNKFPFIQMNIIRSGEVGQNGMNEPVNVSSTLRRMHGKIRDSLRLPSRSRIKPETKLSIENVLKPPRPPPSYEESSSYGNYQHVKRISIEYPIYHRS